MNHLSMSLKSHMFGDEYQDGELAEPRAVQIPMDSLDRGSKIGNGWIKVLIPFFLCHIEETSQNSPDQPLEHHLYTVIFIYS